MFLDLPVHRGLGTEQCYLLLLLFPSFFADDRALSFNVLIKEISRAGGGGGTLVGFAGFLPS